MSIGTSSTEGKTHHCRRRSIVVFETVLVLALLTLSNKKLLAAYTLARVSLVTAARGTEEHTVWPQPKQSRLTPTICI
jgi:hypothetical protein